MITTSSTNHKPKMKNIVLIGIQGSGKGTQARLLAEKYDYQIFETGAELRRHIHDKTEIGQKIEKIMNEGHLVSNEIVMQIVTEYVDKQDANKSIIFDGIPRKKVQALDFQKLMKEKNREFVIVHFVLKEEVAIERLLARGRHDDTIDGIKTRIQAFYKSTEPIIDFLKESHPYLTINANQSIEDCFKELEQKLLSLGS